MKIKKTRTNRLLSLSAAVVLVVAAGCGADSDELQVSEVRVGAPTGPNAALYFTATGHGEADALLSASTEVAAEVQIHETMTSDEGTISMRSVPRLELPASGRLTLEPGGYHLMLVGVDDLEVGGTIEVTLVWEVAGEMIVDAEIVDPLDTTGDNDMEHTEDH